jgi:TPR repeat protein
MHSSTSVRLALAVSLGVLFAATVWSSPVVASKATPATKPTSQPQSAKSQDNLGVMYAIGQGVPQDYAKAA